MEKDKEIQDVSEEKQSEEPLKEDIADTLDDIRERLGKTEKMLLAERNRRIFQNCALNSGIRMERLDAAEKLSSVAELQEEINADRANEIVQTLRKNFPELFVKNSAVEIDNGVPGKIRANRGNDPLEILSALRR